MRSRSKKAGHEDQSVLLDTILPSYEFHEVHSILVARPPRAVMRAIRRVTPGESPWFATLMALRLLPARLVRRTRPWFVPERPMLQQFLDAGFSLLGESEDELVIGRVGQFWKVFGGRMPLMKTPDEFRAFSVPGYAKAAVNFRVTADASEAGTRLSTETRIATTDTGARRKFRAYWLFIRPGSALIRREWLAAIKRRAEGREEE